MNRQRGFTLIELMVVLLIIGVILAAGMLSLNSNDRAQTREQAVQIEGMFKQAQDRATWTQRAYLVAISASGLNLYQWSQGQWQTVQDVPGLLWPEHLTFEWQLPLNQPPLLLKQDEARQLVLAGWLLLPNGEAQVGQIAWQAKNADYDAPLTVLQWDPWLNFEFLADVK